MSDEVEISELETSYEQSMEGIYQELVSRLIERLGGEDNAADEKISALLDGVTPQNTDEFVTARAGSNVKLSWLEITQALPDVGSFDPFDAKVVADFALEAVIAAGKKCINCVGNLASSGTINIVRDTYIYLSQGTSIGGAPFNGFNISAGCTLTIQAQGKSSSKITYTVNSPNALFRGAGTVICQNVEFSAFGGNNAPISNILSFFYNCTSIGNGQTNSGFNLSVPGSYMYGCTVSPLGGPSDTDLLVLGSGTTAIDTVIDMQMAGTPEIMLINSGATAIGVYCKCDLAGANSVRITNNGSLSRVTQDSFTTPVIVNGSNSSLSFSELIGDINFTGSNGKLIGCNLTGALTIQGGAVNTKIVGCHGTAAYTDSGTNTITEANSGTIPSDGAVPSILMESGSSLKISAMTPVTSTSLTGTDKVVLSKIISGVPQNRSTTLADIATLIGGGDAVTIFDAGVDGIGIAPNRYITLEAAITAGKSTILQSVSESLSATINLSENTYIVLADGVTLNPNGHQILRNGFILTLIGLDRSTSKFVPTVANILPPIDNTSGNLAPLIASNLTIDMSAITTDDCKIGQNSTLQFSGVTIIPGKASHSGICVNGFSNEAYVNECSLIVTDTSQVQSLQITNGNVNKLALNIQNYLDGNTLISIENSSSLNQTILAGDTTGFTIEKEGFINGIINGPQAPINILFQESRTYVYDADLAEGQVNMDGTNENILQNILCGNIIDVTGNNNNFTSFLAINDSDPCTLAGSVNLYNQCKFNKATTVTGGTSVFSDTIFNTVANNGNNNSYLGCSSGGWSETGTGRQSAGCQGSIPNTIPPFTAGLIPLYNNLASPSAASGSSVTVMPNQTVTGVTIGKKLYINLSTGVDITSAGIMIIQTDIYLDGVVYLSLVNNTNGNLSLNTPIFINITATATSHVFSAVTKINAGTGTVSVATPNNFYSIMVSEY